MLLIFGEMSAWYLWKQ